MERVRIGNNKHGCPKRIGEGSIWFKRLVRDCKKISPHIKIKRIKGGFYRIYYRGAYIHEIYKECPLIGYDWEIIDPRLESQNYYEEFEDRVDLTRKIKNYKEGYWDAIDRIRTRMYMVRNNKEFYETARRAYKQIRVK